MMSGIKKIAQSVAVALTLPIWLTACTVGPDYVRPPSFSKTPAQTGNGNMSALSLDKWWTQFDDPALTAIIEQVLTENLDLAAALARVDQARAGERRSHAELLPTVTGNAQAAFERQSLESPLGELTQHNPSSQRYVSLYDGGVGASWEIDLAGGLRRGAEVSAAEAQAAQAQHLGVRISIAAEAADAYFRMRSAQQRIALAEEQLNIDAHLQDLVKQRLTEGMSNRRELAEAEARVAQVSTTLPPLRMENLTQQNRLDVLMGVQPGTYHENHRNAGRAAEASTQWTISIPAIAVTLTPEDLLRRRPDVMAAERRLAASSARIGVATAGYYPTFSLSALLGFESLDTATPNAANFQPQALLGIRWRLFDFGRVEADIARAKGGYAEALAGYRLSMLRAAEDVENALIAQTQLTAQRTALQKEVDADRIARNSSQEAYEGGLLGLDEVLEQDRQLLSARDQMAVADSNAARAAVATFRALGGGW